MSAVTFRHLTPAAAVTEGAPKNLAKLAGLVTGRGWSVRVDRADTVDAWVLVTLHPVTGSETGRWGWQGARWIPGQRFGFKALCDWYATDAEAAGPVAADGAEAAAEPVGETAAEPVAAEAAADATETLRAAVVESERLADGTETLAETAEGLADDAEAAAERAKGARTSAGVETERAEAEECAATVGVRQIRATKYGAETPRKATAMVAEAAGKLRAILATRKEVAAAAVDARGDETAEERCDGWHSRVVAAEERAREALGRVEDAADRAAEAVEDAVQPECVRCGCPLVGTEQWATCGCRAVMAATLAALGGGGYQHPDDVRIGRWLDADREELTEAGQLALAGDWAAAEAAAGEPVAAPVGIPSEAPEPEAVPERTPESVATLAAWDAEWAAAGGPAVPVRVIRGDGRPVDVTWTGRGEQCWTHCPDECPGQGEALACVCVPRPVVGIDGPAEPYPWEGCAECAAGLLHLGADVVTAAARVSASGAEPVDAEAVAGVLAEESARLAEESRDAYHFAEGAADRTHVVATDVAFWRAEAETLGARSVALAEAAEHWERVAFDVVFAECAEVRNRVDAVRSAERMARAGVVCTHHDAAGVAHVASTEVRTLMADAAAEADRVGGAARVRAGILPALRSAGETVDAWDAHRAEEVREAEAAEAAPVAEPVATWPRVREYETAGTIIREGAPRSAVKFLGDLGGYLGPVRATHSQNGPGDPGVWTVTAGPAVAVWQRDRFIRAASAVDGRTGQTLAALAAVVRAQVPAPEPEPETTGEGADHTELPTPADCDDLGSAPFFDKLTREREHGDALTVGFPDARFGDYRLPGAHTVTLTERTGRVDWYGFDGACAAEGCGYALWYPGKADARAAGANHTTDAERFAADPVLWDERGRLLADGRARRLDGESVFAADGPDGPALFMGVGGAPWEGGRTYRLDVVVSEGTTVVSGVTHRPEPEDVVWAVLVDGDGLGTVMANVRAWDADRHGGPGVGAQPVPVAPVAPATPEPEPEPTPEPEPEPVAAPVRRGAYGRPIVRRADQLAAAEVRAQVAADTAAVLSDMHGEAWRAADRGDHSEDVAERLTQRWADADRVARDARYEADRLARDIRQTEDDLRGARLALPILAGGVRPGRGAWLAADGGAAITFPLAWHREDNPTGDADRAFVDLLGDAVAARDEGRALVGRDLPSKRDHGRTGGLSKGEAAASVRPLVTPWKAPAIPSAGRALDGKALAALDADGVCAETETAPGVWLPRAAVLVAETAMGNGWAVAVERRTTGGRALVCVRMAGRVVTGRPAREVYAEVLAVWADGMFSLSRSGAWGDGVRLVQAADLTAVCATAGREAEAAPVDPTRRPVPVVRPDVVSAADPVDGWEADGGAVPGVVTPDPVHDHIELPSPAERDDASGRHPEADPCDPDGRAPYAGGFRPAVLDGYEPNADGDGYEWAGWWCDTDCGHCATGVECADCLACTEFAAPYPAHWARDERPGERWRGVEIFGGPGGMSKARSLVDRGGEWVLVEFNRDAADTARAAGHYVICVDVRTLDPRHPVLTRVRRFHGSPPCQTLSSAGKRSGWSQAEVGELRSIMWQASEAFGFLPVDDLCSLYGGPHGYAGDELDDWEGDPDAWDMDLCGGGFLPPCMDPFAYREWAAAEVSDDRTALMAEMLVWPMCMVQNGAPLESITMEQSPNLLKQTPALAQAIQDELTSTEGMGWAWCSWQIADAADTGAASHRERAWMVATRYERPRYAETVDDVTSAADMWGHVLKRTGSLPDEYDRPNLSYVLEPYQGRPHLPTVTVAQALGLPDEWWADTRGRRGINPKTGKTLGGGSFPLNTVSQCVTAPWYGVKFRPADVEQGAGTRVITRAELAALVGFPADYPWQYTPPKGRPDATGQRNVAQMIADAVSPFMLWISSAVNDQAADWYEPGRAYQAHVYGLDGGGTVALPVPRRPLEIEGTPARPALPAAPAPTGRAWWEPGERVTLAGRAGRTRQSDMARGVWIRWDGAAELDGTWEDPRALWAEGTEPAPVRTIAPPYQAPARTFTPPYVAPTPAPVAAEEVAPVVIPAPRRSAPVPDSLNLFAALDAELSTLAASWDAVTA